MGGVRNRLTLLAREPEAGHVKTRLARSLGEDGAARLYRAFLEDLAVSLPRPGAWEAVVAHDRSAPGPELRSIFGEVWGFTPQGDGGLGERLVRCFQESASRGIGCTVVAGSDIPTLTSTDVANAFRRVRDSGGIALAPSPDGGFGLIGLPAGASARFLLSEISWSTDSALADTVAAARSEGLEVGYLPPVLDVDEENDLGTLDESLRRNPGVAKATRRVLVRLRHPAKSVARAGR